MDILDIGYIKTTCKIGQGAQCCAYLGMGSKGFECLKTTSLKAIIDERVARKSMTALSDNCPGYDNDKKEFLKTDGSKN